MNLCTQVLLSSLVQGKENQVEEVSEVSNKNWNIHTNLWSISNILCGQKIRFILKKETKCFSLKKKRAITITTSLLKEWPSCIKNVSFYVYIARVFLSAGNFIFIYALINQDNMIHLQINVILNNFSNVFTNFPLIAHTVKM